MMTLAMTASLAHLEPAICFEHRGKLLDLRGHGGSFEANGRFPRPPPGEGRAANGPATLAAIPLVSNRLSQPEAHGLPRAARVVKARSLQDLQQIQRQLAEQRELAAKRQAEQLQARRRAEAERNLFVRAAGEVQPLRHGPRVSLAGDPPAPVAVQQQLDEQRVLAESISDEFDASTLLDVDDALSFRRPGVGLDVTRKLRKGHWSIQREIDLHGLRREDAREALSAFIREAHRHGVRCVRVVHGKGLGSPGRTPVLKAKVQAWLVQKKEVLAFVQARGDEGGAGAVVVLLKPLGPAT